MYNPREFIFTLDTMSALDILVVSYLFWGFYLGMRRGLVAEAARIVAILIVLGFR